MVAPAHGGMRLPIFSGRDRRYIKGQKHPRLSHKENLALDGRRRTIRNFSAQAQGGAPDVAPTLGTFESRLDTCGRERHPTQPHAGSVEYCVADGRRYEAKSHLGSSGWRRFGAVDQHDLDLFRYRIDVQHGLSLPVSPGDHILIEAHLFEQRSAGAVDELAIDDVTEGGVDDHADIVGTHIAQQIKFSSLTMNTDLGDQRWTDWARRRAYRGDTPKLGRPL
jgi:hypothetical protein